MPGPAPKAVGRQRSQQGDARQVALSPSARAILSPAAPAGLLAGSVAEWQRLWQSPVAATYVESDIPALARLFELRDERSRSFKAATRQRTVAGTKGTVRLSPLLSWVAKLDGEIRNLEDRFGLTPRARLTLGITLGEAHRSLSDLNAEFLGGDHADGTT